MKEPALTPDEAGYIGNRSGVIQPTHIVDQLCNAIPELCIFLNEPDGLLSDCVRRAGYETSGIGGSFRSVFTCGW